MTARSSYKIPGICQCILYCLFDALRYNYGVKKPLLSLLIAVIALNIMARGHAQEAEFDTLYNIKYSVDNSLVVSVKENIAMINQSTSSVPSSFIETITNISAYDIKVYDAKDKEIVPILQEKEKSLVIEIPIENPALGKGKITQITLAYKTRDLAQKTGRILNVNIPKAPVSNYMQEYNVAVRIPKDFGPQISITPKPVQEKMEEEGYVLLYNKQTLEQYGISASFGDYQIFDFELSDNIKNNSVLAKTIEVALPPPVRDYQEVSITKIDPEPLKLKKDADGNILAVYKISGKNTLVFSANGQAKVYNRKIIATTDENSGLIPTELKRYVKPQKYWETGDTLVKSVAEQNKTALAIYTYLTKNIAYDFENTTQGKVLQRKGVRQTLADKKGLCLDYTDAFIALTRAAGIPAREINGYAYTKDQQITPASLGASENAFLHSWAQYYHPKYGWVSVDPTWGATSGLDYFSKLDNNHMAFVIRGLNSQSPQPPQNIKVDFSNKDFFNSTSTYDVRNLQSDNPLNFSTYLLGAVSLGLGLCTIFVVAKVRLKGR